MSKERNFIKKEFLRRKGIMQNSRTRLYNHETYNHLYHTAVGVFFNVFLLTRFIRSQKDHWGS